jgi:hypothetical protein
MSTGVKTPIRIEGFHPPRWSLDPTPGAELPPRARPQCVAIARDPGPGVLR